MAASSLYREADVQDLWASQRFRRDRLLTEDAVTLEVEFPGFRGLDAGPDFRGARLRFAGRPAAGDVEVHLSPSGWDAHGHGRDGAYAGVILHVVLRRDAWAEPRRTPPLLVLEPYLGASLPAPSAERADPAALDALGDEVFAERRRRLERDGEVLGADEALHRGILVALGYRRNQAAMAELARRRPLASLHGGAAELEAALLGEAARMPPEYWRLAGVRPANHPWRRLRGYARFLAEARREGLASGLRARPGLAEMEAWLDPGGAGLIGPSRAREIAANVLLPFLGGDAWRAAAESAPPDLPGLARRELGVPVRTLRRHLGALRHLKRLR